MRLAIVLFFISFQLVGQTKISLTNFNHKKVETLLFDMINEERASKKRTVLKKNKYLQKAAVHHSTYQAKKLKMTHSQTSKKYKTPKRRVAAMGGNFSIVGENVAYTDINMIVALRVKGKTKHFNVFTYQDIANVLFIGWKNSKHHYENILDTDYLLTGISVKLDRKKNRVYATQVFGRK